MERFHTHDPDRFLHLLSLTCFTRSLVRKICAKRMSIFHYLQSMYCAKGNLWFFRIYHSTPILLRNIIIAHLCYTVNPPISHSTLLISHSTLLISDSAFLISHSTLLILHSPPILYRHISQVTWSIRVLYGYMHLCPEKNPVKKRDIPIFFL